MSRPVLCAVDISNKDEDAAVLTMAKRLADLDGAQLDMITVVPDYGLSVVGSYFGKDHHDKAVDEAQVRLAELGARTLGAEANNSVRHLVATGNAYDEILRAAKKAGTGLIVVGAHKPDFTDYLLGPNAARVVRHARCSVFVVRA